MKSLVERLSTAVSEGTPVDWVREKSEQPEHHDAIEQLAVVERIRDAHRAAAPEAAEEETRVVDPEATADALFSWGPLRVLERIGEGAGSEVYRAIDTGLHAEVALKLLRADRSDSQGLVDHFLAEAARLARVHHQNVLVVHGAARHGGRAGIWTELVRGESLEDRLLAHGPLSACEAAVIGLDLCRALAAVHAKGIVHRDVKASNVMREERGRVVLMDFGAGLDDVSVAGTLQGVQGTPIYMAPEQLRGQAAGVGADIYSLGVLLYHLVTGSYPVEASSYGELVERHRRGERVPLRDRRPDLSLEFVRAIEKAIESDPAARYQSAGEMEQALAATIGAMGRARETRKRDQGVLVGALTATVVLVALFAVWRKTADRVDHAQLQPPAPSAPTPGLRASVELLLLRDGRQASLAHGDPIGPGDQLSMLVRSNDSMYVYVFNEDSAGEFFILYPVKGLIPTNPLHGEMRHRLPGDLGQQIVYWTVTSAGGKEAIVMVGSRAPLPDLEAQIADMPVARVGDPVRFGRLNPFGLRDARGIEAGTVANLPPAEAVRRFNDYVAALQEQAKQDSSIFVWREELVNPAP